MSACLLKSVKKIKVRLLSIPIIEAVYHLWKQDKVVDVFRPHLGGYKPGGDYATEVTPLWEYFYTQLGCRTALDVGCAEGWAVKAMLDIGYDAYGIEGLPKALSRSPCPDRITIHDLTKRPYLSGRRYDLVWCSEVVEHIKEAYVGNVVLTLVGNCGRYLAMTYAPPGSGGYHHVNCQPEEYWVEHIQAAGLRYDADLTYFARELVRTKCKGFRHFAERGLVFVRDET